MKILYVQDAVWPWLHGGSEKRMFEIAKRMAKKHEVHILGSFPKRAEAKNRLICHNKSGYGIYYHCACEYDDSLFSGEQRSIIQSLKFAWGVFKFLLKHRDWDIIEAYQSPVMHIPVIWLLKGKAKFLVSWFEVWNKEV